jgi:hypothetical protein
MEDGANINFYGEEEECYTFDMGNHPLFQLVNNIEHADQDLLDKTFQIIELMMDNLDLDLKTADNGGLTLIDAILPSSDACPSIAANLIVLSLATCPAPTDPKDDPQQYLEEFKDAETVGYENAPLPYQINYPEIFVNIDNDEQRQDMMRIIEEVRDCVVQLLKEDETYSARTANRHAEQQELAYWVDPFSPPKVENLPRPNQRILELKMQMETLYQAMQNNGNDFSPQSYTPYQSDFEEQLNTLQQLEYEERDRVISHYLREFGDNDQTIETEHKNAVDELLAAVQAMDLD